MSIADLDPVIHAPKRLGAMAMLDSVHNADFAFLRDHLGVCDSDLSKQMAALEKAGYVSIKQVGHGRSGSTTFKITRSGSKALKKHIAALNELVGEAATITQ